MPNDYGIFFQLAISCLNILYALLSIGLIFPSGYTIDDVESDNIDINIILSTGEIFFGTLLTLKNIRQLSEASTEAYFWATDMLIVKDLSKKTIREVIKQIIADEDFEHIFSRIGKIGVGHFEFYDSYDAIKDMTF